MVQWLLFTLGSVRLWSHIYLLFNDRIYCGNFVNYKFHDHFKLESLLVLELFVDLFFMLNDNAVLDWALLFFSLFLSDHFKGYQTSLLVFYVFF